MLMQEIRNNEAKEDLENEWEDILEQLNCLQKENTNSNLDLRTQLKKVAEDIIEQATDLLSSRGITLSILQKYQEKSSIILKNNFEIFANKPLLADIWKFGNQCIEKYCILFLNTGFDDENELQKLGDELNKSYLDLMVLCIEHQSVKKYEAHLKHFNDFDGISSACGGPTCSERGDVTHLFNLCQNILGVIEEYGVVTKFVTPNIEDRLFDILSYEAREDMNIKATEAWTIVLHLLNGNIYAINSMLRGYQSILDSTDSCSDDDDMSYMQEDDELTEINDSDTELMGEY